MITPDTSANCRQYRAPIVLGMISEKIRINSVRTAEIMPKYASPNIFVACAPTPAAPIVCATVFNESIADKGRSMLLFNLIKTLAYLDLTIRHFLKSETCLIKKMSCLFRKKTEPGMVVANVKLTLIPQTLVLEETYDLVWKCFGSFLPHLQTLYLLRR